MSKLITVFGATGNQGGSVIKHILADPSFPKSSRSELSLAIPARNPPQDLADKGVSVVSADLNSVSSLKSALEGSHTVFLVTRYCEYGNPETEISQGKNVTDVAKSVGVSHIIFSSMIHVKNATKGRSSHGLWTATFVLPGYFMSNYLQMLRKSEDGSTFQLFYPVDPKKAKFPLFDAAADTGLFIKAAIKHADQLKGKRLFAASGYYTAEEVVDTFYKVTGKKATVIQVTPDQFKAALPEAVAEEYLENHLFIEDPGYYLGEPLDETLALLDSKPTNWASFVEKNSASWE